jgi:protein-L-isoaspartate(D-aspartate) O-methyltransferase
VRPWRSRGAPEDRAERLLATLRGYVDDPRVLAAIRGVPRERFVPADLQKEAWDNIALPIGSEQTISQPLVVARMCELLALRGDERVLDVGTGSGYHAAVLARLTAHVWSIEVHPELTERAAASLAGAGIENVTLLTGDGSLGHPEAAPYDAVNVAAAMASVPPALPAQLAEGGRLVGPVDDGDQRLVLLRRDSGGLHESRHERVRFVPLVPRGGVG